ncbi:hypothetical protein AMTR_s00089p00104350, partial [Amborella trichopoda]
SLRGNQREKDRERAQARKPQGKGKDDGLTPEQRRERDAKALQEKQAKKAEQAAGGGNSGKSVKHIFQMALPLQKAIGDDQHAIQKITPEHSIQKITPDFCKYSRLTEGWVLDPLLMSGKIRTCNIVLQKSTLYLSKTELCDLEKALSSDLLFVKYPFGWVTFGIPFRKSGA